MRSLHSCRTLGAKATVAAPPPGGPTARLPGREARIYGGRNREKRDMCVQVDKQWSCGHIGYFQIRWCEKLFNGCKGTSAAHDIIYEPQECSDCLRRKTLPKPFVSK